MTDTKSDIPSVVERTRPLQAEAPVVAAHFLGQTAVFVLGEVKNPGKAIPRALIWSVVPIAAINPTALDSVLARLVLVDAPQAVPLLPDLEGVALRGAMRSAAAEYGSEAINLPA